MMLMDKNEYSILKDLVAEIKAMIEYNTESMISIDVVENHARVSFLAGQISTLKDILEFIKEKEDTLKKDNDK